MKSFLKYTLATILGIFITGILFTIISFGILGMMLASTDKPVQVSEHSVLYYKLSAELPERTPSLPFTAGDLFSFNLRSVTGLNDILKNIKKAEKDDNIDGIYIETGLSSPGIAKLEELRNALINFRKSGKFVITYCPDLMLQSVYYLATASDSIFLNPAGSMQFTGLRSEVVYYKDFLEKLGVEVQVIKHGKFKSAVEPFIRNDMSSDNREQLSLFLTTVWSHMLDSISAARGIDTETLNEYADGLLVNSAEAAEELSLIDGLKYEDQVLSLLERLSHRAGKKPRLVSMTKYSSVPDPSRHRVARNKIAVVYAEGNIVMGAGNEMNIGAKRFAKALRKAREDTTIKSIVLRVNSPGGSALASDIIWREVYLAGQEKPVVASMSTYAASGGYYILAPVDTVLAHEVTLTGSIGVFGLIPNAGKLMKNKLGLNFDVEKTNRYADFGSLYRPLTDGERAFITHQIENTYTTFVDHVSEGRHLRPGYVDSIGQGRIWSGVSAKERNLVDVFGGLEDAVNLAAEMADLEEYRIVELPEVENPYQKLLEQLSGNIRMNLIENQLKKLGLDLPDIKKDGGPVQARLPFSIRVY